MRTIHSSIVTIASIVASSAPAGAWPRVWAPGPTAPAEVPSDAQGGAERPNPAVALPHPLVVEVLYAVPTGQAGDANQDGTRHVSGDEFIELVNPHDKPIQLLGYTLADGAKSEKTKLRFTFPACELPPGGVVVVFNGKDATWTGPVGDAKAAPAKGNEKFHGALVFTMRVGSTRTALGNQGDEVTLIAPNNKPVQRIRWGTAAEGAKPDPEIPLEETVPVATKSSVQRSGVEAGAAWKAHTEIDRRPFSPGEFGAIAIRDPAPEPEHKP